MNDEQARAEALVAIVKPKRRSKKPTVPPPPPGPPPTNVIEALKALARTKKEGGGCANSKRVEVVKSAARLLERPPTSLRDTPDWVAWTEEHLLGIALTCSRVDAFDVSEVNTSCRDFLAGKTGYMIFGVEVKEAREVKTRNGKNPGQRMAFLTLADGSCSLGDVVCFPDAWALCRDVLQAGNAVLVQGERDPKRDMLIVQKACLMSN